MLGILRLLRGKLLVVTLLYAAYFALVVAGGQAIGIWNTSLLKETLAWFVLAGIPLLTKFPETYKSPGSTAARRGACSGSPLRSSSWLVVAFGLYANYEPKMGEIDRTRPESRRARWRAN